MNVRELKDHVSGPLLSIPEVHGLGTAGDHLVVYVDAACVTAFETVKSIMATHAPSALYRIETSAPFQRQR